MSPLLAAAKAAFEAGLCVIPTRNDGSKAPFGLWKKYQSQRATWEEIEGWLADPAVQGIGIVCGEVSGNFELGEFEGRAVLAGKVAEAGRLAADNGLGELWQRLTTGWVEATPGGGVHFHYRMEPGPVRGNTVLARDADGKVLVETRAAGGFTVVAPSYGTTHPSGQPYLFVAGGPATIPTLTEEEYHLLHLVLGMLDDTPAPHGFAQPVAAPVDRERQPGEVLPGEDFAAKHTWEELLTDRGWTFVRRIGAETCWRRPGKAPGTGISATTGRGGYDNIYNFSSSADLPLMQPLSKLMAYAHWHHGGDLRAAVKALAAAGYGTQQPRPALQLVHSAATTGGGPAVAVAMQAHPSAQEPAQAVEVSLTDHGNARLLAARHGHSLRHVEGIGWVAWTGARWERGDHLGMQRLIETIHAIQPGTSSSLAKHKVKSLNYGPLMSALRIAATLPELHTEARALDRLATELATAEGSIDLVTGEHLPPDPAKLHTRTTSVVPKATPTPLWDRFLDDTFSGEQDVISYVQRVVGYSASGMQRDHILPFLQGGGENGKSVFTKVLMKVLGDYATSATSTFLMGGRQSSHETELALLHGARIVLCAEVGPRDRFDEQRVKALTGGDEIKARHLYQRHFTFEPTHHLWLMGNHQPQVDAGGHSFWRRLRLINFPNRVPREKRIADLAERLIAEEGPGILQWVVDGAVAYFREGLHDPASVTEATAQYAAEEDALARFLVDRCHIASGNPGVQIDTSKMRSAYTEWCSSEGERPLAPPHFGRELRQRHGVVTSKSNSRRFYVGVALIDDETPRHWADD